jgi:lipopolysaccharide biosynthesis glycosyltransferase
MMRFHIMKKTKRKEMNIAVILEENYMDYAKVMLNTLFYHHPEREMTVYIFSTKLSRKSRGRLKEIAAVYGKRIEFIIIDSEVTDGFPQRGHWPKSLWNSVLIPYYLPDDVERILYLDVDIVVNKSLGQMYDMKLGNNCIAACEDLWVKRYRRGIGWRLGIFDDDFKYFNWGVNLIDARRLRKRFPQTIGEVERFCVEHIDRMDFVDQDFYNIFCHGSVRYLNPRKYNFIHDISQIPLYKVKVIRGNAAIIHYASDKPLKLECLDLYGMIFWKYAAKFGVAREVFKNMQGDYYKGQGKRRFCKLLISSVRSIALQYQGRWTADAMPDKAQINHQVLLRWMEFLLNGKKLSSYMQMHGFEKLAIYGGGAIGKMFVDFAIKEQYEVPFILDKNLSGEYHGIPIKKSVEEQDEIDVIIVTAESYFDEIEKELNIKSNAHITSISQIIYEIG